MSDDPVHLVSCSSGVLGLDDTRRKLEDFQVTAEWSSDLTASNWKTTGLTEAVMSDDGEIETVRVTLPMDEDRKFFRVRVEAK